MVYSKFTITDLRRKFGLKDSKQSLFGSITPIKPSKWLEHTLSIQKKLPIHSEKAKSEFQPQFAHEILQRAIPCFLKSEPALPCGVTNGRAAQKCQRDQEKHELS